MNMMMIVVVVLDLSFIYIIKEKPPEIFIISFSVIQLNLDFKFFFDLFFSLSLINRNLFVFLNEAAKGREYTKKKHPKTGHSSRDANGQYKL